MIKDELMACPAATNSRADNCATNSSTIPQATLILRRTGNGTDKVNDAGKDTGADAIGNGTDTAPTKTKSASRRKRGSYQGEKMRSESTRMICPHCDAQCTIRTSRQMSRTMREVFYACTNSQCGHTFVAATEIIRTLSPSAIPDPSVKLPLSSHIQRNLLRMLLDTAPEAPHMSLFMPRDADEQGPPQVPLAASAG